jgi:hypothetical protein
MKAGQAAGLCLMLLLLLEGAASPGALGFSTGHQDHVSIAELPRLLNEQRSAAERYRGEGLAEALVVLEGRSVSLNRIIADRILEELQRRSKLQDSQGVEIAPWTPELAGALAALHMEAALQVYERRPKFPFARLADHIAIAEAIFAYLGRTGAASPGIIPRWKLAIGGTALGDGQLWWAVRVLDAACDEHPHYVALLVACGSVHEAIAMLPAHVLLSRGSEPGEDQVRGFGVASQQEARTARRRHLDTAKRMLERALAGNTGDTEALIRLAHVRLLGGEPHAGAKLLEGSLPPAKPNDRAAYLARLVLGRTLEQADRLEPAVDRFRDAVSLYPAQSGRVALAHALHRLGHAGDAAVVIEAMLRDDDHRPDPWAGYTYGQFWTIDPLLDTLRAEARR